MKKQFRKKITASPQIPKKRNNDRLSVRVDPPKNPQGIRINAYLRDQGHATRRAADEIITKGFVTINGRIAVVGDHVKDGDKVEVKDKSKKEPPRYFAYNKAKGIVTTSPQGEEKQVIDVTRFPTKVFPVGRLDKDSTGLLIMTNDGRITDRLLSPKYDHEKEYAVETDKPINESFVKKMARGVRIEDYITRPCTVTKTGEKKFKIILTEGKKHQIRRMCDAFGYHVTDLKRVRIMNILLGDLKQGAFREIKGKEKETFLASLNLLS